MWLKKYLEKNFLTIYRGRRMEFLRNRIRRTIASSFGVLPEEAAYIGDSEVDLATGHAARMQTILVSWGFRGREALLEDGAECIVDSAEEIRKIVKKQEEK